MFHITELNCVPGTEKPMSESTEPTQIECI